MNKTFFLDDFIVTSTIFHETRNGGWGLDKKGNFPFQNPPIYSLKKPWHELLTPSFLTHMSFFLGSKKEWFWLNPLPPFCSMSLFLPFFLELVPKHTPPLNLHLDFSGCLPFWGCPHFQGHPYFWGRLHSWGRLQFEVVFIFMSSLFLRLSSI